MDYLEIRELYHHGIKGQRWGIRRFQNEDGTLTTAGKARYNEDGTRKNPKDMSDEDLRRSSTRIQSEHNYKRLIDEDRPAKRAAKTAIAGLVASGASFVATYSASRVYALATKDQSMTKGKSALLAAMASIGTTAGVVGGRIGQTNVKDWTPPDDNKKKK